MRPKITTPPITAPTAMPAFAPVEREDFLVGARLYFRVKRWVEITWTGGRDWRLRCVVGAGPEEIHVGVATSRWLILSVVEVASSSGVVV